MLSEMRCQEEPEQDPQSQSQSKEPVVSARPHTHSRPGRAAEQQSSGNGEILAVARSARVPSQSERAPVTWHAALELKLICTDEEWAVGRRRGGAEGKACSARACTLFFCWRPTRAATDNEHVCKITTQNTKTISQTILCFRQTTFWPLP